ncbi:hypothetical protein NXS19_004289 [Fusarium pseudograminearum]|nr:hypothetical protein NXS19_004289 [Fusarium pseudograminearum]
MDQGADLFTSNSQISPDSSPRSIHSDYSQQHVNPRREDSTVQLISTAIRHVLNYSQSKNFKKVVKIWLSEYLKLGLHGGRSIKSTDDGGLRLQLPSLKDELRLYV